MKAFLKKERLWSKFKSFHPLYQRVKEGNISFYNGKIRYLDEESGHFKPRNRIFLFEKIYSNNIYTNDCILKHCHLPELPIEERCQMDRVQNLFDLYKYFFYNKI